MSYLEEAILDAFGVSHLSKSIAGMLLLDCRLPEAYISESDMAANGKVSAEWAPTYFQQDHA